MSGKRRQSDTRTRTGSLSVLNRRRLLRGIGVGAATAAGLASENVAVGQAQDGDASLTFEDQTTDGDSVVVAELTMPVDGQLIVQDKTDGRNTMFGRAELSAGTYEDYTVELDQQIEESQTLQIWLFEGSLTEGDVKSLAIDEAFVATGDDADVDVLGVTFVEADPDSGFNYPYFLFTPPTGDAGEVPLLVEPNNTGTATDDFATHRERAKQRVERGLSRTVSEQLNVPLLVPVFPRPRSDPVDGTHYIHALDDTSLGIEGGPLERVDLQLLRMADHAKAEVLSETSYSFDDRIMLNGFSASGNFVDRFAVLHPERVLSVTAGGLNGMALLPLEEADGRTLNYHVGIADVESLVGEPVDLDALDEVNQFLYMGANDSNDTIPYTDAWTDDELRQTALDVYGEDMVAERFPRCQAAYETAGVSAQFRVYEDAGHTTRPAIEDVIEFHRRSMDDEPVDDFGQQLVAALRFDATSSTPAVGETVEFDAGDSDGGVDEITNYLWDFGDGETAVGESVTHTFGEPGSYAITLTVILDSGVEKEVTKEFEVSQADDDSSEGDSGSTDDGGSTEGEDPDGDDSDSAAGSVPGFGVVSALASLGTGGYLLKRRLGDDES